MKTHWASEDIALPLFILAQAGSECLGRLTPWKEPPVSIGEDAGWAPEPVCTLWNREKSLALQDIEPRSSSP
jgi:hypothetical protein